MARALKLTPEELLQTTALEDILTEEEKATAIEHAIKRAKDHFVWNRLQRRQLAGETEASIAAKDWSKEINEKEVLATANGNKHRKLWETDRRIKEKEENEKRAIELKEKWTAAAFYSFIKNASWSIYGKEFIYNDHTEHLIKTWCYFLSKDPRFETELKYSFGKGLLIRGVSGLGKTFIAECLKHNEYKPISIYSLIEISESVKEEGSFEPLLKKILYLDDVGSEQTPINHYGTKIFWLKDFIELYYLNKTDYSNIVISTNLSFDEIEKKYGFRVRSRIKDMFNIVYLKGEDMRGQK